jgi:hypothetical protein
MAIESGLDDPPLHADSSSVNQPYFPESGGVRRVHVLLDN